MNNLKLWPQMAILGFGHWPILDLRHLWLIGSLDINSRFWILDTSGRFWILDPLVADFRFWTLVANFGILDPRGRFYILDTSG